MTGGGRYEREKDELEMVSKWDAGKEGKKSGTGGKLYDGIGK